MKSVLSPSLIRWIGPSICLFFLASGLAGAQANLKDAGKALQKAYNSSTKKSKKAQAYLDIAQVYEEPLRQYELAIDFYTKAATEAEQMSKNRDSIIAAASAGRQRAVKAWLESLELLPTNLEITARAGTKYYSQPSTDSGPPAGVKTSNPLYLAVTGFENGYCRATVQQGASTRDGWFKLATIDSFRLLFEPQISARERFLRYEYFARRQPEAGNSNVVINRMDDLLYEHTEQAGTTEAYQTYLSRFPKGKHRQDASNAIENNIFKEAKNSTDLKLYEGYLETYPNGAHVAAVKDSIEDLIFDTCQSETSCRGYLERYPAGRHVAATHKKIETFLLAEAKSSESIDSLRGFIARFPESQLIEAANKEIDRLTFVPYLKSNTISGFLEFIQRYPESRFISEARKSIDAIEFEPFRKRDSIDGYLDFLDGHPASQYRAEAQARIELLQYEPYTKRDSIGEYKNFLRLFPTNRNAAAARKAIERLEVELVKREVQELSDYNRSLGNKYDVTFRDFSNGTLTVRIPELGMGGQLLRFVFGSVEDVEDTQRRYNIWRTSIIDRLYTISVVKKVIVVE